jgi:hypothetical protein
MLLVTHGRALEHSGIADAVKSNAHAVTRAARVVAPAVKESREIMVAVAGMVAIVVASLALDVWIWVPRSGH